RGRASDILVVIEFYSSHSRYEHVYRSIYATLNVKDELARVEGVGDVIQFGQQDYGMRLWLDPERLAMLNLTAGDVVNAVREQNMQVAAGHFGQPPTVALGTEANPPANEFTITTLGRLAEPDHFENIILR